MKNKDKILPALEGKTPREQATLKGIAIAEKVSAFPREKRGDFDVEVISLTPIEGGVEILARAWNANGEQIGFGKDGTVDVERFRFINPPVVVKDPDGDIINDYIDEKSGNTVVSRGREDAREAILRRLEGVLETKKEKHSSSKISRGKIGSTTTVVDFTPGSGSAGGSVQVNKDGAASYSAAHDATTADSADNLSGNSALNILHNSRGGSNDYYVRRCDMQFDTSSIPDTDVVSAASVTVYISGTDGDNDGNDTVVLLDNTNNGNIQDPLATEDFNDFGTTSIGSRVLSELINVGANRAITMTTFGAINKTGRTRIGFRLLNDINNTAPAGANNWDILRVAFGSAGDNPFITVEHAAGSTQYDQAVTATTAVSASMLTPKTILQALTGTTAVTGSTLIGAIGKVLAGTTAITASVLKGLSSALTATTQVTATMTAERVYLVALDAITAVSASTATAIAKVLTATSAVTGVLTKTFSVGTILTATTAVSAVIEAGREKVLQATTVVTATIQTAIGKTLTANVSIVAKLLAPFWRTKYPAHGDGEDYEIKYPHE